MRVGGAQLRAGRRRSPGTRRDSDPGAARRPRRHRARRRPQRRRARDRGRPAAGAVPARARAGADRAGRRAASPRSSCSAVEPDGAPAGANRLTLGASAGLLHPLGAGRFGRGAFPVRGAAAPGQRRGGADRARRRAPPASRADTGGARCASARPRGSRSRRARDRLVVGERRARRASRSSAHDAFGNPTSAPGVAITVDGVPRPVAIGAGGIGVADRRRSRQVRRPRAHHDRGRAGRPSARARTIRVTGGAPARLTHRRARFAPGRRRPAEHGAARAGRRSQRHADGGPGPELGHARTAASGTCACRATANTSPNTSPIGSRERAAAGAGGHGVAGAARGRHAGRDAAARPRGRGRARRAVLQPGPRGRSGRLRRGACGRCAIRASRCCWAARSATCAPSRRQRTGADDGGAPRDRSGSRPGRWPARACRCATRFEVGAEVGAGMMLARTKLNATSTDGGGFEAIGSAYAPGRRRSAPRWR